MSGVLDSGTTGRGDTSYEIGFKQKKLPRFGSSEWQPVGCRLGARRAVLTRHSNRRFRARRSRYAALRARDSPGSRGTFGLTDLRLAGGALGSTRQFGCFEQRRRGSCSLRRGTPDQLRPPEQVREGSPPGAFSNRCECGRRTAEPRRSEAPGRCAGDQERDRQRGTHPAVQPSGRGVVG